MSIHEIAYSQIRRRDGDGDIYIQQFRETASPSGLIVPAMIGFVAIESRVSSEALVAASETSLEFAAADQHAFSYTKSHQEITSEPPHTFRTLSRESIVRAYSAIDHYHQRTALPIPPKTKFGIVEENLAGDRERDLLAGIATDVQRELSPAAKKTDGTHDDYPGMYL